MPGEPIPVSQPNKGSLKERNAKKRRKLKHDFIVVCYSYIFFTLTRIRVELQSAS